MSFGFGFALPAYQLRGGGGNNPFNQNGPTLDLSFAGTVTDASNPKGYTLNTNFITPQYQIAAQYVIWETGVGLVDKTFSQIITFTRASGATWFNSAGNLIGVDFSTSSNTIGTGSKTFTLDATAGVNRSWATGDSVLIVDQANSANNMTGTVTSYTASTQVLVVNVTSTAGSGTITSWRIGNLMQRLDYNPSTLAAQGLLIEEQRTNSIRNNTMQGAVAGTPGTAPTNWGVTTTGGSITRTIVGTGTENGITYIDIRYVFTGAATAFVIPQTTTEVAALTGQTWTASSYAKLVAGSLTNLTARIAVDEYSSVPAFLVGDSTSFVPTGAALSTQRFGHTRTLNNASTAFVVSSVQLVASGAADITLRIGLPQLEQGAFATSVIPTTTTALTRSADVASVNTLSPWFNATEGTLFAEYFAFNAVSGRNAAAISDGTLANRYSMRASNSSGPGSYGFVIVVSSVNEFATFTTTAVANAVVKMAGAYKISDAAYSYNGGSIVSGTPANLPNVTSMQLGSEANGINILCGYLRRITYYPRRLSNAELQAITA